MSRTMPDPTEHETTTRPPIARSQRRILVVDDYQAVREIVRTSLERRGFEICEAESGVEAIEKAKKLRPDLILLDLAMPGMNGVEAASVLHQTLPETPIVALTMYEQFFGPTLAAAVGIRGVISKVDSLNHLGETVETFLSGGAPPPRRADAAS